MGPTVDLDTFPEPLVIDFSLNQVHLLWSSEHDSYYDALTTVAYPSKVVRYAAMPMPEDHSDRFVDFLLNPAEPDSEQKDEYIIDNGHHRLAAAIARKEYTIKARVHMPLLDDNGCVLDWPTSELY